MTALEERALAEMEWVAEELESFSEPDHAVDRRDESSVVIVAAREAAEELRRFVERARMGMMP